MHHIVSILGIVCGLIGGYNQVIGVAGVLLCEISSIFLSFRGMQLDKKATDCFSVTNQLLFFLTYTIFRIIFFPYLGFRMVPGTMAIWYSCSVWRRFCITVSYILTVLLYFLNVYWYILIVKNVCKMTKALRQTGVNNEKLPCESLLVNGANT